MPLGASCAAAGGNIECPNCRLNHVEESRDLVRDLGGDLRCGEIEQCPVQSTTGDSGKPVEATCVSRSRIDRVFRLFGYVDVRTDGQQTIRAQLSPHLSESISVAVADGDDRALIEKETGSANAMPDDPPLTKKLCPARSRSTAPSSRTSGRRAPTPLGRCM